MNAPCKGCTTETGRHPGCHDKCPKYKEFYERNEERKKHASEIKTIERLNGDSCRNGHSIRRKFRDKK